MLGYIVLLVLSSSHSAAPYQDMRGKHPIKDVCAVSNISQCSDLHTIVKGEEFRKSLKLFFGDQANERVRLHHEGRLADQVEEILGGPADGWHQLRDNRYLFTTCRTSECGEGGAIAFDPGGKIVAVAVISLHCAKMLEGCLDRPVLDLFMNDKKAEAATREAIFTWASR